MSLPRTLGRYASEYGMVAVLLALCALLSVLTYKEHTLTGEAAGRALAAELAPAFGPGKRAAIVVRPEREDVLYAEVLRAALTAKGGQVDLVQGEPRDARAALNSIASSPSAKLDFIAASAATRDWLLFRDLAADFPQLGNPRIVKPQPYKWPTFLERGNLLNITSRIAVIAIVSIGMTLVIVTAGIDLSVGSLIALSAVICSLCMREFAGGKEATALGMLLCALAAMLACGGAGLFSGSMITLLGIPPFIATLAMMLIASGCAYMLADGQSIAEVPASFTWLGRGADLAPLPNSVLLMLLLYAAAHVLMSRMRLGRYIYAVGGNREAARLSGVPVRAVTFFAYATSGLLAGLGGVMLASQFVSGSPTYGQMYELYVIAGVVVGGASLSGGEGKMFGTLVGALIIGVIENGMNLLGVKPYQHPFILGLVILGAVILDRLKHRGWRG